ncbi:hypothetical protein CFIMG_003967RAa [Ceratocystis fimbriata CBS 114723]|uniref:Uncharacterized protein n=1 Tax=Ceratocystis fimbriata CBS 114723 TaxID=1035309 RepID=A0A2C5XDW2_9PEZI|nr:hypothetical protein CFIMG_003967RAa [Ceratocystis fimbriata CBS 114723]
MGFISGTSSSASSTSELARDFPLSVKAIVDVSLLVFELSWPAVLSRDRVGSQDTGLGLKKTTRTQNIINNMLTNMRVNSGQYIIQQVDISTGIYSTGQGDTSLLATTQRNATFADICLVTVWQLGKVVKKGASSNRTVVEISIITVSKDDVVLDSSVENPRLLSHVCDSTTHFDLASRFV